MPANFALSPEICPKTANFQLANYLSKRLFKSHNGSYLVCLPSALLQEVAVLTFNRFLEPEAEKQSPEQFAQSLLKEIFNLFYQYSGVRERMYQGENGCLYLGTEVLNFDFEASFQAELKKTYQLDVDNPNLLVDPENDETSH